MGYRTRPMDPSWDIGPLDGFFFGWFIESCPDDWCVWNMSLGHEKPIKNHKSSRSLVAKHGKMCIGRTSSSWVKQGIQYPPAGWFQVLLASAVPIYMKHSPCKNLYHSGGPNVDGTGNETISFTPDVVSSSQAFVTGFTRFPVQSDMVSDEHVVVSENERALLVFPKHVV